MKRFLVLVILTLSLIPTTVFSAASCDDSVIAYDHSPVCACYHDVNRCEVSYPAYSLLYDDADCRSYCQTTYGAYYMSDASHGGRYTCLGIAVANACIAQQATADAAERAGELATAVIPGYATPQLSIKIPGVDFETPKIVSGMLESNFIGIYISGVYKFLIGFAIIVAIVMMMIGGLQYVAGATSGDIEKAKTRIRNAVEGFVLLLFVYVILFTVNPELTIFENLKIANIGRVEFVSTDKSGEDVEALGLSTPSGTGTNGVPYYSQRNFTDPYPKPASCGDSSNATIKSSGCGPTSMAMVLSFYGVSVDPKQVAANFVSQSIRGCVGTSYSFGKSTLLGSSLTLDSISKTKRDKIIEHLKAGEPLIVSIGPKKDSSGGVIYASTFTKSGHFIVLTGVNPDGSFAINDPNSGKQFITSDELWNTVKEGSIMYIHKK